MGKAHKDIVVAESKRNRLLPAELRKRLAEAEAMLHEAGWYVENYHLYHAETAEHRRKGIEMARRIEAFTGRSI